MTDPLWRRDEVESPCINICVIHPATGLCTGCARSMQEITDWSGMTPEDRRAVIAQLPAREAVPTKRRGGRAARQAPKL